MISWAIYYTSWKLSIMPGSMFSERREFSMSESETNERTEFGRRLKEAREYLELSQDEVARELGIPRTAISLMESGQRKVEALELRS